MVIRSGLRRAVAASSVQAGVDDRIINSNPSSFCRSHETFFTFFIGVQTIAPVGPATGTERFPLFHKTPYLVPRPLIRCYRKGLSPNCLPLNGPADELGFTEPTDL